MCRTWCSPQFQREELLQLNEPTDLQQIKTSDNIFKPSHIHVLIQNQTVSHFFLITSRIKFYSLSQVFKCAPRQLHTLKITFLFKAMLHKVTQYPQQYQYCSISCLYPSITDQYGFCQSKDWWRHLHGNGRCWPKDEWEDSSACQVKAF